MRQVKWNMTTMPMQMPPGLLLFYSLPYSFTPWPSPNASVGVVAVQFGHFGHWPALLIKLLFLAGIHCLQCIRGIVYHCTGQSTIVMQDACNIVLLLKALECVHLVASEYFLFGAKQNSGLVAQGIAVCNTGVA